MIIGAGKIVLPGIRSDRRRKVQSRALSISRVIDAVKAQLESLLRERRNIADNEDDDFRVMDTRQIAETLRIRPGHQSDLLPVLRCHRHNLRGFPGEARRPARLDPIEALRHE